jgi:hypothetical protein
MQYWCIVSRSKIGTTHLLADQIDKACGRKLRKRIFEKIAEQRRVEAVP